MNTRDLLLPLALLGACALAAPAAAQSSRPGAVVVKKFYDANANGVHDPLEPWLTGWPMTLTGPGPDQTKDSTASFTGLTPGLYFVREAVPLESNWVQSAPTDGAGQPLNPKSVHVCSCETAVVKFGNYCIVPSGGNTPGFWGNKNGARTIADDGDSGLELGLLSGLNLVDADGNGFDPLDHGDLRGWLRGSNATNMAYKLSSQLAAMTLNVEAGRVDGDATFVDCGCTINELIAEADAALAAAPYTPNGHPQRAAQEVLKDWLDGLNNDAGVVPTRACDRTFYSAAE